LPVGLIGDPDFSLRAARERSYLRRPDEFQIGGGRRTLLYAGYLIARLVARTLPIAVAYWLAERFADCWYLINAEARRNVRHNLELVPGLDHDSGNLGSLTRRIMSNFARMVTEFFYLPGMDLAALSELVDLESFQKLKRIIGDNNAVLATAHVGNWELAAAVAASIGIDLHVVVYDHPDPRVAKLFRRYREAKGIKVMPITSAATRMRSAVRAGSLGIVADRDFTGKGIEVSFLGARISVPSGYVALAVSEGVPIIPGFCLKDSDGKYRLTVEEPLFSPGTTSPDAADIVGSYIRLVEKQVEKHPEQWYLFDRVGGRLQT
jgi:lauroyl/myristoyl acyltransferase